MFSLLIVIIPYLFFGWTDIQYQYPIGTPLVTHAVEAIFDSEVKKLLLQNFASAVKFHVPQFAKASVFLQCSKCITTCFSPHSSVFNVCCGCRLRADYDDSYHLILFSCLSISPCPSDSPLYSVVPVAPGSLFTSRDEIFL